MNVARFMLTNWELRTFSSTLFYVSLFNLCNADSINYYTFVFVEDSNVWSTSVCFVCWLPIFRAKDSIDPLIPFSQLFNYIVDLHYTASKKSFNFNLPKIIYKQQLEPLILVLKALSCRVTVSRINKQTHIFDSSRKKKLF